MATILYFDCMSGASGDMILASLVDCGVPVGYLGKALGRLGISGLSVGVSKVVRNGVKCSRMRLAWKTPGRYRHLPDILRIIKRGRFGAAIYERCEAVLDRIASAEANAHGIPRDHVHFHEIGAIDTIVDIAGVNLAIDYLKVDEVRFSTLTDGCGTIETEHGMLPVPVPATANLVRGFHFTRLGIETELLTPTGAALLTTLGKQSVICPAGRVIKTGYGCGTKEFEGHPNYLRAFLLETEDVPAPGQSRETVDVLETDMDHVSGELLGNAGALLLESGALDVSWTPLFMKKGRPAYRLTVIASPQKTEALVDCIMFHTRTLGVRVQTVQRVVARREAKNSTLFGLPVTEKICRYKNKAFVKAEYEDLAKIAREKGIPLIEVMEEYASKKRAKR